MEQPEASDVLHAGTLEIGVAAEGTAERAVVVTMSLEQEGIERVRVVGTLRTRAAVEDLMDSLRAAVEELWPAS